MLRRIQTDEERAFCLRQEDAAQPLPTATKPQAKKGNPQLHLRLPPELFDFAQNYPDGAAALLRKLLAEHIDAAQAKFGKRKSAS